MSLSGNTEKITELLSKINALPEAGSGGSTAPESCSLSYDDGGLWNAAVYTTPSGETVILDNSGIWESGFTITDIAKGSNIVLLVGDSVDYAATNAEMLGVLDVGYYFYVFRITGNATLVG